MKELLDAFLVSIIFLVALSPLIYYTLEAVEKDQELIKELERLEQNARKYIFNINTFKHCS